MVHPHKWSPVSCRPSAGQRKHAGQGPTLYHWTTQPTNRKWCMGPSNTAISDDLCRLCNLFQKRFSRWQDFNWLRTSRGPSAIAERLAITRKPSLEVAPTTLATSSQPWSFGWLLFIYGSNSGLLSKHSRPPQLLLSSCFHAVASNFYLWLCPSVDVKRKPNVQVKRHLVQKLLSGNWRTDTPTDCSAWTTENQEKWWLQA